jgi:hypothetical protein
MQDQSLSVLPNTEHVQFSYIFVRYTRNLWEEHIVNIYDSEGTSGAIKESRSKQY